MTIQVNFFLSLSLSLFLKALSLSLSPSNIFLSNFYAFLISLLRQSAYLKLFKFTHSQEILISFSHPLSPSLLLSHWPYISLIIFFHVPCLFERSLSLSLSLYFLIFFTYSKWKSIYLLCYSFLFLPSSFLNPSFMLKLSHPKLFPLSIAYFLPIARLIFCLLCLCLSSLVVLFLSSWVQCPPPPSPSPSPPSPPCDTLLAFCHLHC